MSNHGGPKLPAFRPSYRASDLVLHVTSLPSPYGIGNVDWLQSLRSIKHQVRPR